MRRTTARQYREVKQCLACLHDRSTKVVRCQCCGQLWVRLDKLPQYREIELTEDQIDWDDVDTDEIKL